MRWLLALIGSCLAVPALADTTAVYSHQGGMMTMTVEIASSGEIRVTMGGKMLEEMKKQLPAGMELDQFGGIVRDGENYLIQPGSEGKPLVIRMRDAAAVMKEYLATHREALPAPADSAVEGPKLVARGIATINGRTGRAFYSVDGGQAVAVISADPDLAELGTAMRRQFATSVQMMGSIGFSATDGSMDAILAQGAPLSFGGMDLQTVKHDPIPAARFVLPAQPASLDQVRSLMTSRQRAVPVPAQH